MLRRLFYVSKAIPLNLFFSHPNIVNVESHAVPQHIQSYQFRLVGDMTLKQFSELAAGVVISLILYSLPIYWFIKWPLILLFVSLGVGLAFVPIEDRPLETWLIAFFKAVYAPTQYLWRKSSQPPDILVAPLIARPLPGVEIFAPQGKAKLQEYLRSLPPEQLSPLDQKEKALLANIDSLFQTTTLPSSMTPTIEPNPDFPEEPSLMPHPLHSQNEAAPVIPHVEPTIDTSTPATAPVFRAPRIHRPREAAKSATFSLEIPIPITPTIADLVVGMVLTSEGKIVESAIIEIRETSTGHPVRATKTNKIGQFSIVTPLKLGPYTLVVEKDGLTFDPVSFEAKGQIIPPIEIHAKPPVN